MSSNAGKHTFYDLNHDLDGVDVDLREEEEEDDDRREGGEGEEEDNEEGGAEGDEDNEDGEEDGDDDTLPYVSGDEEEEEDPQPDNEEESDEDAMMQEEGATAYGSRKRRRVKKTTVAATTLPGVRASSSLLDSDEDDGEEYGDPMEDSSDEDEGWTVRPVELMEQALREDLVPQKTYAEVSARSKVVRDAHGNVVDTYHRTVPWMTKYEAAALLGMRIKQLEHGSAPLVDLPEHLMHPEKLNDQWTREVAVLELKAKCLPFIVQRPVGNQFEYWRVQDLEIIDPSFA